MVTPVSSAVATLEAILKQMTAAQVRGKVTACALLRVQPYQT